MVRFKITNIYTGFILVFIVMLLTGCPGSGDTRHPDEEGHVIVINGKVCLAVDNLMGYYLSYITINPRGTPLKEQRSSFSNQFVINNNGICIPSSYHIFSSDGIYFIRVQMLSKDLSQRPRRIVSALEVKQGVIHGIRPNDVEILRPYDEMIK